MELFKRKHHHHHHHSHHHHHHSHTEKVAVNVIEGTVEQKSAVELESSQEVELSETGSINSSVKLSSSVDDKQTSHHHHRHHHRKHKKRKSLFHFSHRQKHYRGHRSDKKKMTFMQGMAIVVLLAVCIGAPMAITRIYERSKNQAAQQSRQEEQTKREKEQVMEKDINTRLEEIKSVYNLYLPGFVCWGESLTAGSDGNGVSYPKALEEMINENLSKFDVDSIVKESGGQIVASQYYKLPSIKVINMGARDENTVTTLGRNGADPFVLTRDATIPAGTTPVEIFISNHDGDMVTPMRVNSTGMNYVVIGGITGKMENQVENTETGKQDHFIFTRNQEGGEVTLRAGTEIVTSGSLENLNLIPIVFIGQNEHYADPQELIEKQQAIIEHQQVNENIKNRFLIIGQPFLYGEEQLKVEKAMEEAYGLQYVNVRDYMLKQGLADAGIIATEKDKAMILDGKIPESLCSSVGHFNEQGYELLGKLIYQRMVMLGYFEEVEDAIQQAME